MANATAPTGAGATADPMLEDAAKAAALAVAGVQSRSDQVRLTSGILLRLKPVPTLVIREAALRVKNPVVPVTYIESKGREEENPNDPDYLKQLEEHASSQILAITNALLMVGVEVLEVPEGMYGPESDEWAGPLFALGLEFDITNPHIRRLQWLRLYALEKQIDINMVIAGTLERSGVTEVDVARAVSSFRRDA